MCILLGIAWPFLALGLLAWCDGVFDREPPPPDPLYLEATQEVEELLRR